MLALPSNYVMVKWRGRASVSSMAVVTIMCSKTGDFVSTGLDLDRSAFDALPSKIYRMRCPSCGSEHVWAKGSAWLSGFGTASPPDKREEQQTLKARQADPVERMISEILGERE